MHDPNRELAWAAGALGLATVGLSVLPIPNWLALMLVAALAFCVPVIILMRALHARDAAASETLSRQRDRAQAFTQRLIDLIPQPVFVRDRVGRFVMVNTSYLKVVGREASEVIGRDPHVIIPDAAHVELMLREDGEVFAGKTIFKESVGFFRNNGDEPRNIVVSKGACEDIDGNTVLVGSHFDVSPWRRTERQLQEALQRETDRRERVQHYVQRLIDVIPQPVYVKDAESRYVMVNQSFCRERGKPASELLGQVSWELARDERIAQLIRGEDQQVLNGLVVLKEECMPHMYTGQERFRLISKATCLDDEGRPVIVGANFDVTPWRQAERALQAALEREVDRRQAIQDYVQRLIDVIPHPVYVKDAHSRYLLVNEAFARDRGQAKSDLVGGLSVWQTNDVAFNEFVLREDAEVLAGKFILKEEHKPHPFTGQDRYRVVAKGSCLDADGSPVIVCAIFDVTGWRLAEARWMRAKEAAERANEAKSRFLANVSHELRTPMHAVLSFAGLGETRTRDVQGMEKLHGYFLRIVQSGESLLRLLNDLLDLAKLEAGRVNIAPRAFDLVSTLHQVVGEFSAMIEGQRLQVEILGRERAMTKGDPPLVAQVVRNLVSNAIKFSPQGGSLSITVGMAALPPPEFGDVEGSTSTPAIEFKVADQGPGIPEHELEAVFEKFVQSTVTGNAAGGTGLGLAICREIVQLHGGLIFARNRVTTRGAEFVVRLPAAQSEPD